MRALVTGAAGQDGTILSTLLAREGADVVAVVKPGSDTDLLLRYAPGIEIAECDLADAAGLRSLVRDAAPDEVYNLGGFTAPGESWEHQEEVRSINVDAVAVLVDAARQLGGARLFQASSASIFEGTDMIPQTERSRRAPVTPYAQSKADAMDIIDRARADHGLFAVSGILYNHESPLRGEGFVTRRISMGVARIAAGLADELELGDVEVARDWGWAPDYVRGMQLMLRADVPHDYVLATGVSHRLSFFLSRAFRAAGIEDWSSHVRSMSDRKRANDTNMLVGDSVAAYRELGWRHTVDFDDVAARMVAHDIALLAAPGLMWSIA
ncbi:MAG: GDP-mannose 4,6-dehydratase [Actinomycetota bacterium]|nr:GDP-mannose 4,6-dehydratase [Actinomycetota bacterium]